MSQTKNKGFGDYFPAPEPRQYQRQVIEKTVELLKSGKKAVAIDAPPGFGKSITLWTIAKMLEDQMDFNEGTFYTTPLKSLQDQLVTDEFVGDKLIEIKGRSNYRCIHQEADDDTTVDRAPCQKTDDFDCEVYEDCNYYGRKMRAIEHPLVVNNFAYLLAEGNVDPMAEMSFGNRDLMIIDECQSIEDWAINFIGFTVSQYSIPDIILNEVGGVPDEEDAKDMEYMVNWLRDDVLTAVDQQITMYSTKAGRTDDDLDILEKLQEFESKVERFLHDQQEHEWTLHYDWRVRKNRENYAAIEFKPVHVGRFLDDLLWNRADKFIFSSATIPGNEWFREIGLGDEIESGQIARIPVPSPFPVENRPIITGHAVGKFTYNKRDENMPAAVKKVKAIAEHHEGEKGIIHARSYGIADKFKKAASNTGNWSWFNENVVIQDRYDREGSLQEWIDGDKQIFLSVNMAEGIDLKYDKCRWQVLLKVLYPFMDKRAKRRKEIAEDKGDQEEFWTWYNGKAVVQIEQAYGRAVRASDDEAIFYILDESANGLIQRSAEQFHKWFLEGVNEGHRITDSGIRVDPDRGI